MLLILVLTFPEMLISCACCLSWKTFRSGLHANHWVNIKVLCFTYAVAVEMIGSLVQVHVETHVIHLRHVEAVLSMDFGRTERITSCLARQL